MPFTVDAAQPLVLAYIVRAVCPAPHALAEPSTINFSKKQTVEPVGVHSRKRPENYICTIIMSAQAFTSTLHPPPYRE